MHGLRGKVHGCACGTGSSTRRVAVLLLPDRFLPAIKLQRSAPRPGRRPGPTRSGLLLSPHQEEALIEIVSGANVILSTPTGSGKSLVAAGAHFTALAQGR